MLAPNFIVTKAKDRDTGTPNLVGEHYSLTTARRVAQELAEVNPGVRFEVYQRVASWESVEKYAIKETGRIL